MAIAYKPIRVAINSPIASLFIPTAKRRLAQLNESLAFCGLYQGYRHIPLDGIQIDGVAISGAIEIYANQGIDRIAIHVDENIFIFLVYAPHVYDANEVSDPKYKILAYTLNIKKKAVTGLKAASKDLSKLVETYNGSTSLVVQSSPDGKQHYALMPHNFSHQQFIDPYTPDAANNYVWSSSINEFKGRYYIGSNMAYRPNTNGKGYAKGGEWTVPVYDEKGILVTPGLSGPYVRDNCQKARHTFRTVTVNVDGKDIKKTIYDLDIESVLNGQAVVYSDLGGDRYRPLYKNYIRYRETPAAVAIPPDETDAQRKIRVDASLKDPEYVRGALLNTDSTVGDYGKDGYEIKYTIGIAALDKDKALMRDVEVKYTSENKKEGVTAKRKLISSVYQVDPRNGRGVLQEKTTVSTSIYLEVLVQRQKNVVEESFKFGDVTLESLTKTSLFDYAPGVNIGLLDITGNGSVVTEKYPGSYMSFATQAYRINDYNGSLVSGYYNGGFPVTGEGPVSDQYWNLVAGVKQTSWGHFIAGAGYKISTVGGGGINVLMFDNYNGDDTWIIFYKVETYNNTGKYGKPTNGVYGTYSNTTTTTYQMAYRITHDVTDSMGVKAAKKEALVTKTLATCVTTDTGKYVLGGYANLQIVAQSDGNATTTGSYISAASCQIGQGLIVYTFNEYTAVPVKFKKRTVGVINIDRAGIEPLKVFETETFKGLAKVEDTTVSDVKFDDDLRFTAKKDSTGKKITDDFVHDRLCAIGIEM